MVFNKLYNKLLDISFLKKILYPFPKEFGKFIVNEAKSCLYQLGFSLKVFGKLRKSFLKFGKVRKRFYFLWETFGEGNVEMFSGRSCHRNLESKNVS